MKADEHAYPIHAENHAGYLHFGLEARDYIAIQAMVGLSASPELTDRSFDEVADMAYKQADAMIKRSEAKDEQSI